MALIYEPAILGGATVRFVDRRRRIDEQVEKVLLALPPGRLSSVQWEMVEPLSFPLNDLVRSRPVGSSDSGAFFTAVPESANSACDLKEIARSLSTGCISTAIWHCRSTGIWIFFKSRI